ncbi:hypothetical protein [Noviherbaspirillum sp. ST9]|uniref:hypothetical protein n=1 Tax=Noviherbaspirillum sp. ST9 TaxID=3401606 RepID=UPI003B58A706
MQVRHFFAALMLAFGIGQQALAEEPKKPDVQQEMQQAPVAQEQAATSTPAEEKPAAAAEAPVAPATPVVRAEVANPPSEASASPDWIHSFFYDVKVTDVLLAVFAGLLVLLGRDLARRMRDAVSAAKDSAAVAEKSATVAEKSARVAEDALISGQRAFMFIREIKTYLHQDPATGQFHWTIHPIWANSGNTPTRGLSINTSYRLLDAPLPAGYDFPESQEDLIPTIAGPRSMVEAVSGTLSSEDLAAVKEGRKFFYIWGWAEYHDIFEGTKKRVTRFCNQLIEVDGDPAAPVNEHNPLQMMFGFHAENNYAD